MMHSKVNKKFRISILGLELIIGTVFFGCLMCLVNSYTGYREFMKELEDVYGTVTEQFAWTASTYVNGDSINKWMENGIDEEWHETNNKLIAITESAELVYVYTTIIAPDYKSRTYIFDTVNSKEKNSKIIEFGTVQSLEKKDDYYIGKLRSVIEGGITYSMFSYKKTGGHVTSAVPVYDSNGNVCAIMSVVKPMHEVKAYRRKFIHAVISYAIILTALFITIYALILYFGIIRPVVFITYETSHFAEHHGELTGILKKIHNRDELGTLAQSVEKMSTDMNRYITDLTNATAEKERLGAELNVATQIQAEMLPRVFPPFENHPEVELFATMEPAKEVGGDFYDFYMIDDDHFAIVVGDVSGKGVPAALFMVITKTLLKDTAAHEFNPAKIFMHVNNLLCEGNESGLFVTCWMGILTISTGELTFANAGHTPPLIFHQDKIDYLTTKPNLMLAGMEGIEYACHQITLDKNDRIFVYTDGVTEATNEKQELYGEKRLLDVMKTTSGLSSREILNVVKKDIEAFVKDSPQFDDITMLEMAYKGRANED